MFPKFLCIGAQKAGTTWLYINLKHHPALWLPPIKEIHYFDRPSRLPLLLQAIVTKRPKFRQQIIWHVLELKTPKQRQHWPWFLRFLLLPRHDQWYCRLFFPSNSQMSGEITPAYARLEARLEANQVRKIHQCMPETKIIFILRNPVDRMWSQAAMYFLRWYGQNINTVPDIRVTEILNKPGHARNSEYLKTLQIWQELYPASQLYIGFFDQLVQHPHTFLKNIYHFLGVDTSDQYLPESVSQKQHAGPSTIIPDRFSDYLHQRYDDQILQLHQQFGNPYTAQWVEGIHQQV